MSATEIRDAAERAAFLEVVDHIDDRVSILKYARAPVTTVLRLAFPLDPRESRISRLRLGRRLRRSGAAFRAPGSYLGAGYLVAEGVFVAVLALVQPTVLRGLRTARTRT